MCKQTEYKNYVIDQLKGFRLQVLPIKLFYIMYKQFNQFHNHFQHIANYSHKELGGFHDFWISDYKNILVELNISNNHISRLPANVPWALPSLKTFNASCNNISAIRVDPECSILCKRSVDPYNQSFYGVWLQHLGLLVNLKSVKVCIQLKMCVIGVGQSLYHTRSISNAWW